MSTSNKLPLADYRLKNINNALYVDGNDDVVMRTGFAGNIVISGNVNVPGTVNVDSTPDNPVHVHLTEVGTFGNLTSFVPVAGNVVITGNANVAVIGNISGITTLPAIRGNVGVSGNVSVDNFPSNVSITQMPGVTGNVHVWGNVSIDQLPGVAVTNFPSNVSITQMPGIAITSLPEVEIKNDTGNAIPISIIKNGLAVSDTVALPTRVFNDEGLIAISRGSPITESDVVASYLIDKSGATGSLGTDPTTMVTVWDGSGLYPWNTFTGSGDKLYVKTSTDDPKVRGKTVLLEGLDSGYNLISETITLNNSNSTTAVSTTLNFYRVVRATLSGTNTNYLPHDYNVEIRYGSSSGTLVEQITAPYGRTQSCLYSVPVGHEAYILNVNGSSGYNDEITSMIWTRPYNDTWRQIKTFKFISGTYEHNFRTPIRIPEKSDLEMRAYALVESSRIGVEFQLLIVPKP